MTIRNTLQAALLAAIAATSVTALADGTSKQTKFTIAAIPDTQNYVDYSHQKNEGFPFDGNDMFQQQMQYIADHVQSNGGDIAFVDGLGDNWQHQTKLIDPEHAARGFARLPNSILDKFFAPTEKVHTVEMPFVKTGWELLNGKVPFSVVPGNHDYDSMWPDSKHPQAAQINPKDLSTLGVLHSGGLDNWRTVFGADTDLFKGKSWYVASHDGGADSAQIFSAGGYRFLHIGLQFDAPNASLAWAESIIKQYPGLPTIVTTHDYLDTDASRVPNPLIDNHAVDPEDNTPQMVWDKFISQHDQIFLVLCGHEHGENMRVDPNKFGHKVWQVLADYQDRSQTALDAGAKPPSPGYPIGMGDGWFRLMSFDFGARTPTITVKTYSSAYGKYSGDTAQYAQWYRAGEQPQMSDEEFYQHADFVIDLDDFRARFDKVKAAHAR